MGRDQGREPRWYIILSAMAAVASIIGVCITLATLHPGASTAPATLFGGDTSRPTATTQFTYRPTPTNTLVPVVYPATRGEYTGCIKQNGNYSPASLSLTMSAVNVNGKVTGSIAYNQTQDTVTGTVTPLVKNGYNTLQFKLDHYLAYFTATIYGSSSGNYFSGTYSYPTVSVAGTWYAYPDSRYCNR